MSPPNGQCPFPYFKCDIDFANFSCDNFFDFKAFNYTATKLSSQAQKGSKIAIEGVLKQDKWEDDNGKHSKVIVYAESVEIIAEQPKQEKQEETPQQEESDMPF